MKLSLSGKWILLGEHAVLRGKRALVFPFKARSFQCDLQFSPAENTSLQVSPANMKAAWEKIFTLRDWPQGQYSITALNEIPLQAGLGSSAALSVAAALWRHELGLLEEKKIFAEAHSFENIFHGSSSGLDIAGVLAQAPILFQKEKEPEKISLAWSPHLYLMDTGLRSSTKAAVEKVQLLGDPFLDTLMDEAVSVAHAALEEKDGYLQLCKALHLGEKCFSRWGLIPPEMKRLSENLFRAGAQAIKPTGSGDGGFLLSLWKEKPSEEVQRRFGLLQAL